MFKQRRTHSYKYLRCLTKNFILSFIVWNQKQSWKLMITVYFAEIHYVINFDSLKWYNHIHFDIWKCSIPSSIFLTYSVSVKYFLLQVKQTDKNDRVGDLLVSIK